LTAAAAAMAMFFGRGGAADELVKYEIVDESSIPKSLTGKPGDPVAGRQVAINRRLGNCLSCHKMPIPEQQFHGEVGPDLAGVAGRYEEGELRLRVVDPKAVNPDTIMPAFYRADGLHRVMKDFQGKTVLTAEQVEDVVAYMLTLKEQ
jgi:sulfur-oxidizing protein SoxX